MRFFSKRFWYLRFGSNGALWSLANEFWYYIAFALLLSAAVQQRPALRIAFLSGAVLIGLGVGAQISLYFLIWSMGVVINFLPRLERHGRVMTASSVIVLFLSLSTIYLFRGVASDFVIGLATTFLIYCLLQSQAPAGRGVLAGVSHRAANMSYTLYVVHLPMVVFFTAWLVKNGRWRPDPFHLFLGILVIIAAVLYARAIARLTEARTGAIRERVSEYLDWLFPVPRGAELTKVGTMAVSDRTGR